MENQWLIIYQNIAQKMLKKFLFFAILTLSNQAIVPTSPFVQITGQSLNLSSSQAITSSTSPFIQIAGQSSNLGSSQAFTSQTSPFVQAVGRPSDLVSNPINPIIQSPIQARQSTFSQSNNVQPRDLASRITWKLVNFTQLTKSKRGNQEISLWVKKQTSRPINSVTNSISIRNLQQSTIKKAVRDYIYPWWNSPIGQNLPPYKNLIDQKVLFENETVKCIQNIYETSKPGYLTMNIDQPNTIIYPGAFVQGNTIKTGAEQVTNIPINPLFRHPISLNNYAGNIGSFDPSSVGVMNAIKQDLVKKGYPIQISLGFAHSYELPHVYEALNFNSRVAEKLGFSLNAGPSKCRYYVFMSQYLNQYSPAMVSPDGDYVDAIGVFLKDTFTKDMAQQMEGYQYWGRDNIPTYVDRVIFGRFFAASVEQNQRTLAILAQIKSGGDVVTLLSQLWKDPSARLFSKGPFNTYLSQLVQTNRWLSIFNNFPNEQAVLQRLTPIVHSFRDFKTKPVKLSNALRHRECECTIKQVQCRVWIQLEEVFKNAEIFITKSGSSQQSFTWVGEGTTVPYDITDSLSSDPAVSDYIRISNAVDKRHWYSQYQRKVILNVWFCFVDDAHRVYSQASLCAACHSVDTAFGCSITKANQKVSCQAY